MLGEFLEIALATPDILASVEFYRKLGFSEAPVGGARRHPYTVMTDGRLYLGLHKREAVSPALCFVLPDLSRHLPALETLGIQFEFCNIGLDQFNELGFADPDGGMVTLVEARTYSPVYAAHVEPSHCGYFLEYRRPARDPAESARFWESLGLIVTPAEEGGYAQAAWGGINLGLPKLRRGERPALVFENGKLEETVALLEMRGLSAREDDGELRVETPEGIELWLRYEGA
jgi:catechol 2,3-dioxygenase-like lactoylglutathione lyase family enzyme